jgi:hypothetical protein
MAIVCASVSCPDLRKEAFSASKLDEQLEQQTVQFLLNDRKGARIDGDEIRVSKIFDWFEDDFETYGGVKPFVLKYRKGVSTNLELEADLPYDWSLNIKH